MLVRILALTLAAAGLLVPTAVPAAATPDNFTPRPGATFNSPLGNKSTQRAIYRRIMRTINSTPRGEQINIFSWNFLTQEGTDALLRAQRRGVRVRLIMDDRNVTVIDNPPYRRLSSGLRRWNRNHPRRPHSWARLCRNTCRGGKGAAHSKFFMFSQAGRSPRVVMQGSANLTVASTTNQWNDIYTHTRNKAVWRFYSRIFEQAARDRKVRRPYATKNVKDFRLIAFPNRGRGAKDPVMQMLNRVACKGATNARGGRTKIQIAPDVIRQKRGMRLAQKLRQLWNRGCRVRIGYTVVGIEIGRYLRSRGGRGPVPMKHLTQDRNGDGEFDNYFHMKSMVIRGNYGGNRGALVLLNGSANWSGLAASSDENLGIYRNRRLVRTYEKHLDYWYENFPAAGGSSRARSADGGGEEQLIFGGGRNAVYEDGSSVTGGAYDPFASRPQD